MIKVKNKGTGVESPLSPEQWEKVQKSKRWAGVFTEVKSKETPPEVKVLREAIATEKAEHTAATVTPAKVVQAADTKTQKPADKKA